MFRKFAFLIALVTPLFAQVAAPSGIAPVLPNLSRTVENTRVDLARLRIDKWKTNGETKQGAQANAQSLQRNMQEALPALISAVQKSPQSTNAAFKLYRNVNVLYDVMSGLTETAGAFGGKEEYNALARDLGELDQERRSLGDALDNLTAQNDAAVARVQQAAHPTQAEAQSAPPKKIIIDDEAAPKKASKTTRKKPAPKSQ